MLAVIAVLASQKSARAGLIAEYTFDTVGTVVSDNVPADPSYDMTVQPNGASFASANILGVSHTGTLLGQAGRVTEPVEPTSEDGNYGFWIHKDVILNLPAWTILMWVNRQDLENDDFFFYVGAGDGYGGTGPETYVLSDPSGRLALHNYLGTSNLEVNINGGSLQPGRWHQVGLVRDGTALGLYLDGEHLGTALNPTLTSFNLSGNSVLVFGAAKWMRLASMRTRVHDGLIDQVEIYNHVLGQAEIEERFRAFVPEPAGCLLALLGGLLCLGQRVARRPRIATGE